MTLPIRISIIFMGFCALLAFLYLASGILVPLAFGVVFALGLYPVCKRFEAWGVSTTWSIIWSMLLILVGLAGLIFLLSSQLAGFAENLPVYTAKLSALIEELNVWLQGSNPNPEEAGSFQEFLINSLESGSSSLQSALTSTAETFSSLIIIPVYTFLFLLYRKQLKAFFLAITPDERSKEVREVLDQIQKVIKSYVGGLATVIAIIAVLNSVGLLIVGIEHPFFFGIFAALLTIIPYFGVIIGGLPPLLIALTMGSWVYPVGVLIVFSAVQVLEGNFLTPKIVGSKVNLNPLTAIVALLIGGQLWGIAGMILFIPVAAVLKVFFDSYEPLQPLGILLGESDPEPHPHKHRHSLKGAFNHIFHPKDPAAGKQTQEMQPGDPER